MAIYFHVGDWRPSITVTGNVEKGKNSHYSAVLWKEACQVLHSRYKTWHKILLKGHNIKFVIKCLHIHIALNVVEMLLLEGIPHFIEPSSINATGEKRKLQNGLLTERPSFPNFHIASCMDRWKWTPNKDSVTSCKSESSYDFLVILFLVTKANSSFKKESYLHTISWWSCGWDFIYLHRHCMPECCHHAYKEKLLKFTMYYMRRLISSEIKHRETNTSLSLPYYNHPGNNRYSVFNSCCITLQDWKFSVLEG